MQKNIEKVAMLRNRFLNKKLVFVAGNFNIVHSGHLRILKFAKSLADILIVGLFSDNSPGVMVSFANRREVLNEIGAVDNVIEISSDQLLDFVKTLQPDIVVKGKEHEFSVNREKDIVLSYGGQFIFSAGDESLSSRDLIRHQLAHDSIPLLQSLKNSFPDGLISNHSLIKLIRKFSSYNLCVIGDLIVDEYIECNPLGMSQEDPSIVVTPIDSSIFLGGAGIVAAHLVGLGAKTSFFSVVGHDLIAEQATSFLAKSKVRHQFVIDNSRPTTLKKRFRAGNKTLLRVSHLRNHDIERKYQLELLDKISIALSKADGLIFSDFNYGCLPQILVDEIIAICRQRNIPYFADSQSSSQVGDISRYKYADLLCATERESRIALNDFRSGLQHIGNSLIKKAEASGLLLKLGREGLLAIEYNDKFLTHELKALNPNPVDVAGAGDALLATAALTRISGGSVWEAAYLGSVSAGIQVSRMGNLPVSQTDLESELS